MTCTIFSNSVDRQIVSERSLSRSTRAVVVSRSRRLPGDALLASRARHGAHLLPGERRARPPESRGQVVGGGATTALQRQRRQGLTGECPDINETGNDAMYNGLIINLPHNGVFDYVIVRVIDCRHCFHNNGISQIAGVCLLCSP